MSKIIEFIRSARFTKDEKLLYKDLKKKYKSGEDMERTERLEYSYLQSKNAIRLSLLALSINISASLASIVITLIKNLT